MKPTQQTNNLLLQMQLKFKLKIISSSSRVDIKCIYLPSVLNEQDAT